MVRLDYEGKEEEAWMGYWPVKFYWHGGAFGTPVPIIHLNENDLRSDQESMIMIEKEGDVRS